MKQNRLGMDEEGAMVAARVLFTWATARAEDVATERIRRDLERSMDDLFRRWRHRRADAAIAGGFAVGAALIVAAAARGSRGSH
jgi:hypothetical protein